MPAETNKLRSLQVDHVDKLIREALEEGGTAKVDRLRCYWWGFKEKRN